MIDSSGRLFGKVSLLDIFIVLAIAALFIGFVYSQLTEQVEALTAPTEEFYVTFEINRLRRVHLEVLEIGDTVFRRHSAQPFGVVTEIDIQPSKDLIMRRDGTAVYGLVEDRYRMIFTVRAQGSITSLGHFVNGNDHVAVGATVQVVSNRVYFHDPAIINIRH